MKDGKIVVARLWHRYGGDIPSRAPIILGIGPQKYQTICIYLTKNSEKPNFFEEKGCKAFYVSGKKSLRIFDPWTVWKLSRILKHQKVDILHCHRHKPTVYGSIAAMLVGTPVVISHVHGISRTKNPKRKLANFFIFEKVNKIVTVGEAVRQDVLKTNPFVQADKVVSIGNSIDCDRYANVSLEKPQAKEALNLPQDSFVFGTVARLAPPKGHIHLIRAFARVKQQIPSAHLVLVGDGRLRNRLEAQAVQIAQNSIHFLGWRNNVPELLRAMDVYVHPSIGSEGLPRALLEAMVAGIPCIGAAAGGIPEIITNNETGFLVPPKGDCALAEAMIKFIKMSEAERADLTEKAKQHVRNFYTHKIVIEKLESIYLKEIIAKQGFREYVRHNIRLSEIENKCLPIQELHAQYNPDRFEKYKSLHTGSLDTVLDMSASPHCRFLSAYERSGNGIWFNIKDTAYYKLQRLYGKKNKSAVAKVKRFIKLYEDIKHDGFNSKVIVVNKPIIENEFNSGYEIYEGHHRIACCILLGIKCVPSEIVEVKPNSD